MLRSATLLFLLALPALVFAGEIVGKVVSVHDGDTLTVLVARTQVRIRLTDIDAPERKQPFGTRSRSPFQSYASARMRGSLSRARTATGAPLAASSAPVWTRTPSRSGVAWRGSTSSTRRKTRRCMLCRRKRRIGLEVYGLMHSQCRRGTGDEMLRPDTRVVSDHM